MSTNIMPKTEEALNAYWDAGLNAAVTARQQTSQARLEQTAKHEKGIALFERVKGVAGKIAAQVSFEIASPSLITGMIENGGQDQSSPDDVAHGMTGYEDRGDTLLDPTSVAGSTYAEQEAPVPSAVYGLPNPTNEANLPHAA